MTLEDLYNAFNSDNNKNNEPQYTCSICGVTTAQIKANINLNLADDMRNYKSFHTAMLGDHLYVVCNCCMENLNTYTLKALSGQFGRKSVRTTIKQHMDACRRMGIAKRIANTTLINIKRSIDNVVRQNSGNLSLDNWSELIKPAINKAQVNEHCYVDCVKLTSKTAKKFIKRTGININPMLDPNNTYLLLTAAPTGIHESPFESEHLIIYLDPGNVNNLN